ncbi:MAG: hypothetical protein ACK5IC_08550 [Moheibacter sp.]
MTPISNKGTKKKVFFYLFLVFFALTFLQCSSDDDIGTTEVIKNYDTTLKVEPIAISNGHNLSNLQVNDFITYKFTITTNVDSISRFELYPETGYVTTHQVLGEDYELYTTEGNTNNDSFSSLKIDKGSLTGTFRLKIKKPGNFKHQYRLEVYTTDDVNPAYIDISSNEILFNAVKINAYTYSRETRDSGLFHHSEHDRYFYFHIDTGKEQYDNYLSPEESLEYQAHYENIPYTGTFVKSTTLKYKETVNRERGPAGIPFPVIKKITFQKNINGTVSNIEYTDIPITDYGRHDEWGENGTQNFE